MREAVRGTYSGYHINAYGELTTWLVNHATWIYARYLLYYYGQTSYERCWARHYTRSICVFSETLLYRPVRQHLPKAGAQCH